MAMADLPLPLFTCCKFKINGKIPNKDGKLFKLFTNTLNFKISSIDPLVIEKDWPSQEEITELVEALKEFLLLNSKNCISEDNQGETSELQRTKENIQSGELEQISPLKADTDKQLTKHTGIICDDASNKDMQAVGNDDIKHELIKVDHDLKGNDVPADQEYVSANECAENVSSENTTVEEIIVSGESRLNDRLQIKNNSLNIGKQTQDCQVLTIGSTVADELDSKMPPALLNQTHLPVEGICRINENPTTRLLEKCDRNIQRNKAVKETTKNENMYKTAKSQKLLNNDMGSIHTILAHGRAYIASLLPVKPSGHHHNAGSGTHPGDSGHSLLSNDQNIDCLGNEKTTYSGNSDNCIFSKGHNIYYAENERSKLKVQILKTDITKLEVDCIVNATNKRLQHAGGVAKAISSASGPALKKECEDFIQSGNQVALTDIFVSTGGNMSAKCVIHAVGPNWESYDDNSKSQCLQDLRRTVIRCLVEADRRGFTSIGLPSISAGTFKVPKEACAGCYMKAVKHFGILSGEQTSLRDIRFVDVDEAMVKIIQEHFQRTWTNSCDSHTLQEDGEFAKAHVFSAAKNAAKNTEKLLDTNKLTSSSSSVSIKTPGASNSLSVVGDRLRFGNTVASCSDLREERSSVYQIGKFTLHTDTRPAFNHSADITITVGQPFDKLSGLHDFSVSSNMKHKESLKNMFKVFSVSKPKSQQKLVCALLPEPGDADTIKEAIGNLSTIIQSPNKKIFMENIRKVVLTSSILYDEPYNTQKKGKKHTYDRKKVGYFARCLFDYLDHSSGITASSISITVVGSEEALQCIHRVLESRGVKKISPEVHQGASSMAREPFSHHSQGNSGLHPEHAAQGTDYTKQDCDEDVDSSTDYEETCVICAWPKPIYPVRCCGKYLCQTCEQRMSICPFCRTFWRVSLGNQPPGTMTVYTINDYADGYENTRVWEINYSFPSGLQQEHHPNPGKTYTGMSYKAFLPINEEGKQVLKLLRLAFLRKLTFTICRSLTMNGEDLIVWNDIHHKINLHGGPHGYPDSNYLFNVTQELARKGVTFDKLLEDERYDLDHLEQRIVKLGYFTDIHPR